VSAVAEQQRRTYRRWTVADTERLRVLAAGGSSCYAAAKALTRDPKVVREIADREGIVFVVSRRAVRLPPPEISEGGPYKVTLNEVAESIREQSRTSAEIAALFAADWRRVNGMLATLLRQGRARRIDGQAWVLGDGDDLEFGAAAQVAAEEIEARRYVSTPEDVAVLAGLRAASLDVCGACCHYSGPLVRRPGEQLRGRCLVLGADVVPQSENRPCGRGYAPASP